VAAAHDDPEPLHSARKAAKQLRYGAEALGKPGSRIRKRAKEMIKVLGEHQDSVVARPVIRDLGMAAHLAGENGFTFGLLHAREESITTDAVREFTEDTWPRPALP
jgi:CHAD domain-containing protein